MQRIVALAVKDLRILLRVKSGLFFTFIWPVVVAVLFGFVFSGQSQGPRGRCASAIVDEDNTDALAGVRGEARILRRLHRRPGVASGGRGDGPTRGSARRSS